MDWERGFENVWAKRVWNKNEKNRENSSRRLKRSFQLEKHDETKERVSYKIHDWFKTFKRV